MIDPATTPALRTDDATFEEVGQRSLRAAADRLGVAVAQTELVSALGVEEWLADQSSSRLREKRPRLVPRRTER